MGFWPFGGGKRQRVVVADENVQQGLLQQQRPSDAPIQSEKSSRDMTSLSRGGSKNRRDDNSRRLSKSRIAGTRQPPRSQTTPLQTSEDRTRRINGSNGQFHEKALYQQNPLSQSSLGPENFTVTPILPTLHAKRSENDNQIPRRKSSKRKAEDYAREREIKAMSSSSPIPIPKRPGTIYNSGPLQRDVKHIPGNLNRRFERPTSEVSLPRPESLPEIDDISNQNSFKVGLLAALSPRPTIRYDSNPRLSTGKQPMRHNIAIQQAIAEEDVSDKKRINELADDLDANGLRELMERDRRRREKKKETDRAKLQRRLQRRAERQREEEAKRARTEAFVRESPMGSEHSTGLGLDEPETVHEAVTVPKSETGDLDPFTDGVDTYVPLATVPVPIRNPFEDEKDEDIMQVPHEFEEEPDLPIPQRSPLRSRVVGEVESRPQPSHTTLSPPTSPVTRPADRSSVSQGSASLLGRETTLDIPEASDVDRRASDQSSQRLSSWTMFFKRGTRKYVAPIRGTTPSEFSNTSRESFQRKQKQPPAVVPRTFRRTDTTTPQRTMSKFREDLPELPISPPESRLQSPEAIVVPATLLQPVETRETSQITPTVPSNSTGLGNGSSLQESSGLLSDQQRSLELEATGLSNPPMILSQSLASVDSEASWLSGRPSKRVSGLSQVHTFKPGQSSLQRPMPGAFEHDEDDDEIMDDEYYHRLSQASLERRPSHRSAERKASSTIIDLQREGQPTPVPDVPDLPEPQAVRDGTWHGNLGRTPTLVQQAGRAKSKEGLLNEYTAGENESPGSDSSVDAEEIESPGAEIKETPILRARSVEYKGHIRHMSAGSAKILDIKRSSINSDINRAGSPIAGRRESVRQQRQSTSTPLLPENPDAT